MKNPRLCRGGPLGSREQALRQLRAALPAEIPTFVDSFPLQLQACDALSGSFILELAGESRTDFFQLCPRFCKAGNLRLRFQGLPVKAVCQPL